MSNPGLLRAEAVTCKRNSIPLISDFKVSSFSPRTLILSRMLDTGERRGRLTRHNICQTLPRSSFLRETVSFSYDLKGQDRDTNSIETFWELAAAPTLMCTSACTPSTKNGLRPTIAILTFLYVHVTHTRENLSVRHVGLHLVRGYFTRRMNCGVVLTNS